MSGDRFTVRPAGKDDAASWLRLRRALWPETPDTEHRDEIERFFAGTFPREPWWVLLAVDAEGRALGLAEVSIRPYAEGCSTSRVAYLEGWFVSPQARRRSVGRALVRAAEKWGLAQGCREFASDADPDNIESCAAHLALGFTDAGLVRCFRKSL
jgi:aminoglycoside 6'-N-acetyltransferase I